jgi:hypothetical protein
VNASRLSSRTARASLGAGAARYAFTAADFHRLPPAGLPAHPSTASSATARIQSGGAPQIAISNRRLISTGDDGIAFRWKDYREDGLAREKTMKLSPFDFIRRFLVHVLPNGFHRIRHYGLLANGNRREAIAAARELLGQANVERADAPAETETARDPRILPGQCPCCGSAMRIIETFARGCEPRHQPSQILIRIDTS